MGLRVWDQAGDAYDHTQQANNWARVDYHDHTPGRGVQIPSDGIEPGAITAIHLSGDLAGNSLIPAGVILPYTGSVANPAPDGFVYADGAAYDGTLDAYARLYAVIGNTHGGSSAADFHVPNMSLKFPLGAGAGHALGAVGGSLTHTHIVPNHSHTGTFNGTASGLSGSVSVSVTGATDNENTTHTHNTGYIGAGEGFFGSVVSHAGDKVGDIIVGSPGAGQSGVPYKVFVGTSADTPAHAHAITGGTTGSGSATDVGGAISVSGTVGSGTNPSGGTLASGNNSAEPPYLVVNYIIKL